MLHDHDVLVVIIAHHDRVELATKPVELAFRGVIPTIGWRATA